MLSVAIVMGTYNRRSFLQEAIESCRSAVEGLEHIFIVVDGGSDDGSRAYLACQPDVVLIGERSLNGAVRAFNRAFAYAVDLGVPYVFQTNDDAVIEGNRPIQKAISWLEKDPHLGAVAFEFDTWGNFKVDQVHGKPYVNYGVIKTAAGRAVAQAQGDPSGKDWWNPIYHTYGADSEFGAWMWKLGFQIQPLKGPRVLDKHPKDALRAANEQQRIDRGDSKKFWERWRNPEQIKPGTDRLHNVCGVKKLHIGCGGKHLAGWLNVDGMMSPATDKLLDLYELDRVRGGGLEQIYWCHGPEHIFPNKLLDVLSNMRRLLRPNGALTVATIDFEKIYQNRFKTHKNGSAWNSALYGETDSHHHPFLAHRQCFTEESLTGILKEAGFVTVRAWRPEQYPCIHNLNDYATSCRLVTVHLEGLA